MCSSCRNNQNPQTVKLSPGSSVTRLASTSLPGRYASVRRRLRPNRPHIPSTIQFSKSADTKPTERPYLGRTCRLASRISNAASLPLPYRRSASKLPVVSVMRCLGPHGKTRKRKIAGRHINFARPDYTTKSCG